MSHTATVETKMTCMEDVRAACEREKIGAPAEGKHKFYDGTKVSGILVNLKGWSQPLVIKPDGTAKLDNYGGSWGDQKEFDKFKQSYAVCAAKRVALQTYQRVAETKQSDGSVKLECYS